MIARTYQCQEILSSNFFTRVLPRFHLLGHHNSLQKMFGISFHTDFIKSNELTFPRREIDLAWADTANKHFSPKFRVDIILRPVEEYKEMIANPTRSLKPKMEA